MLTPAERRALVLKPFPALATYWPGKIWAGRLIRDTESVLSDRTRANAHGSADTDNYLPAIDPDEE